MRKVWVSNVLLALFCFLAMAYLAEMSYESEVVAMLVPASMLAAWFLVHFFVFIQGAPIPNVLRAAIIMVVLTVSQVRPIHDWLGMYRVGKPEGTRAAARNWIQHNIMSGSEIYIAPYPYTAPLIKSVQQLEAESPDAELTRWRMESEIGRALSPTYSLVTVQKPPGAERSLPEYYVLTSFAHLPGQCSWKGAWVHFFCPYDPLRGSFPHFSQVNQLPEDPLNAEMVLLREFNPICPESRDQVVYINYRTNVLRSNIRHLCSLGPIIQVYRLSHGHQSESYLRS